MLRPSRRAWALTLGVLLVCVSACGSSTRVVAVDHVSVTSDGTRLKVQWNGGGCDQPDSFSSSVDETTTTVTLHLTIDSPHQDCPAIAISGTATVHLESPLGDRTIIDGSDPSRVVPTG